ncbi:MAG: hypothetical protein AAB372_03175 [Patescibacteria group bacterium]
MNKYFYTIGALGVAALLIVFASSLEVSAAHVVIDSNLSVSPVVVSFETAFPGEIFYKPIDIDLSDQFLSSSIHNDVEYRILQKPKPRRDDPAERAYCAEHSTDYTRCYPSLCPFLSKTPDGEPANDIGVPAFHDPDAPSSVAMGRLAKSDNDVRDRWIIDLHTPCFRGECDQASNLPLEYQLDPQFKGEVFGCDLVIEITDISYNQCIEERIPVVGGDGVDPTPLHVDSYSDLGTCNFATNKDVIVDGAVVFPTNCPNGAKIQTPALRVTSIGSITYNKGDGLLKLISTQKGITIEGPVTSIAKDPIQIKSAAGVVIEKTLIRNSNNNGDVFIESASNILIASSTVANGKLPPADVSGDELKIVCATAGCKIQILDSILRTRTLDIGAKDDVIMRGTWIDGRDPRGDYKVVSEFGSIDASAGTCRRPNKITNGTEGSLNFSALAEDVILDDIYIRVPEFIKATAGNIVSMIRADISNDFAKRGDIIVTAGGGTNDIRIQDARIVDDNLGTYNFARLNNDANPAVAARVAHHAIGIPLLDN